MALSGATVGGRCLTTPTCISISILAAAHQARTSWHFRISCISLIGVHAHQIRPLRDDLGRVLIEQPGGPACPGLRSPAYLPWTAVTGLVLQPVRPEITEVIVQRS